MMKLFIFGSTGDLVKRKVLLALQELNVPDLKIYALGRRNLGECAYKDFICSEQCSKKFRNSLNYLPLNFDNLSFEDLEPFLDREKINYFYLSVPPEVTSKILIFLGKLKEKNYELKILGEKPFGEDLKSAEELRVLISNLNLKGHFFISDHYLFKKGFQKLPMNFKDVTFVSIESVGLEGRINYYDSVGALKDMIQSHFFNVINKNLGFKIDFSKARLIEFVFGQYEGYVEELGKISSTETYVLLKFELFGKTFEFITGKGFFNKIGFMEIDGKIYEMGDENSYVDLFKDFLNKDFKNFVNENDSIFAWEFIEELQRRKRPEFRIYERNKKDWKLN